MRARAVAVLAATVLAACTDPTAAGGPPGFVTLGEGRLSAGEPLLINLPTDSCPVPAAPSPAWVRRPVGTDGVTIALAAPVARESAGFGARPGRVFLDRWLGFVAVTFDDDLAEFTPRSIRPVTTIRRPEFPERPYGGRCTVTIDGRPATLLVTIIPRGLPDGRISIDLALPIAILRSDPAGRRVSVVVAPIDGLSRPLRTDPDGQALLAMGASLRW